MSPSPSTWHFDIDSYLNPFVPAPRWHLVPKPIAHMLGHRDSPVKPIGNILIAGWSLLGAFCGVALVASVSKRVPSFEARDAPAIVGSFVRFHISTRLPTTEISKTKATTDKTKAEQSTNDPQGAAAVIEFCAIDSPFAQPRNAILSQVVACAVGVSIAKLFALSPAAEQYTELGGALACALTTAIMLLTNTVHPPAGATALLAVTNEQTARLGWFLFPVMLLGAVLMQVVAVVVNNVQRRYPLYWWTAGPLSGPRRDLERKGGEGGPRHYEDKDSLTDVCRRLVVEAGDVLVPDGLWVSDEEREVLERISGRI
jgi:hypothetical protein